MIFVYIWIIVGLIGLSYGMYLTGKAEIIYEDDRSSIITVICLACFFWPLCLMFVIAFGPFMLFYKLGERSRLRKEAKEEEESTKNK